MASSVVNPFQPSSAVRLSWLGRINTTLSIKRLARKTISGPAGFGGGGTTVAYNAARQQFYVLEDYDDTTPTLSAYHYTDNAHITLLWQRTGEGVGGGGSAAIGPTGNVYSAGDSVIWELDPATGATLRSIPGEFASGMTPALTNSVLWIVGLGQVFAYDLGTLQLLRAF
jgi:hypothetical protein